MRKTLLAMIVCASAANAQQSTGPFKDWKFRSIGPAVMGGRIHDVASLQSDPSMIIVATATGGLWRSNNHGTTWTPIFENQSTATFGVVAIAASDNNVLWAGTGEQNNRQSSSWGDGVYRSTDGGKSWTHVGLEDSRAIGRIVVDPKDPNTAFVAALGNLWAPNRMRGVFKTTDAGKTWSHVLQIDTLTGVVDMVMDPHDARVLYAAAYQHLRQPCCYNGGGPGSAIYKSVDAGATWKELTGGLPVRNMGRIGLAVARSTPGLIYATIESDTSAHGFYRSMDGGEHWTRMSRLNDRPSYYSSIYVDPTNDQRVFQLARWFYMSEDGGARWRRMPTEPTYDVGLKGDYHALWIDPNDSRHFYLVGDGGLYESFDRGNTYRRINNLPIAQFYGIGLDDEKPFNIYGGMQDNHSYFGPSATRHYLGIIDSDWREIGFNDGLEHQVDLAGIRYVFSNAVGGDLTLVDATNGDRRDIAPAPPAGQLEYRWEWMTPGVASRHTPGLYYYGAEKLFITRDRGVTWTATKDLTRNHNRDTIQIMGVRDADVRFSKNDGESAFSSLSAISESPLTPLVLWAGSDDGNIQVSRDAGATWTEVSRNLSGVPDGSYISRISASASSQGSAYVAIDNHRRGDFKPYALRTQDFGKTWTPILNGLPADGSVRFIGEHPKSTSVLFLGTEHALYVSVNRGEHWDRFGANLPTTIYMDVKVQPRTGDIVVATHGRSIWVFDDASALTEWTSRVAAQSAYLFDIRPAAIWQYWEDNSYRGQDFFTGENPPEGAIIDYSLGSAATDAKITISNAAGRVIRTLTGANGVGVHRVTWDLRHEAARGATGGGGGEDAGAPGEALPVPPRPIGARGPWVSPGTYTVTLVANGTRATRTVQVLPDPGKPELTVAQYRAREAFLLELTATQNKLAERLRAGNASAALRRAAGRLGTLASQFNGRGAVQGSLYPPTITQRRILSDIKKLIL
jgi:photosystem II stability/assembly factor-like uncharacterized protein